MNKRLLCVLVSLSCFFLSMKVQSGPLQRTGSDSVAYQYHKEDLKTYERSFKPSFYDTEVYLYTKTDTTKSSGKPIDNTVIAQPETLQGFRIQLIATTNYDEALSVRNDLNKTNPDLWIYTVFESPTYKVRVGDFVNRAEAKTMLDKFRSEGFKTAWLVPDKIIRNQIPKPPLPSLPIDSTSVKPD